jgi:hypothetical protein
MGRHIQVETALRSHPKFRRLCRLAGLSERDAIGALTSLWLNVREVCPDGKMPGWEAADLDDAADTPGISEHLISVGFVDHYDTGMECHDWPDHSGRQCRDAERKAQERLEKSKDSPRSVHASRARAGREGKGREGTGMEGNGKETTFVTADAATVERSTSQEDSKPNPRREWDDALDLLWEDFPRKVGKPAALRAWRAIRPHGQETFDAIDSGLRRWLDYWKGKDRESICHPATWLNQRRWENEP